MNKKLFAVVGIVVLAGLLVVMSLSPQPNKDSATRLETADIFKSMSCGCCGVYSQYMERQGFAVNVINTESLESVKNEQGVPSELSSCHTTVIGGYFVEGHIPVETIEKLLTEKPDMAGIAMPGMPSGSPGMPGTKKGDFVIYAVGYDGGTTEFMRM